MEIKLHSVEQPASPVVDDPLGWKSVAVLMVLPYLDSAWFIRIRIEVSDRY